MDILQKRRSTLASRLREHPACLVPSPGTTDVHLLVSCLLKALRRGDRDYGLGAASALIRIDPSRFWRRLVVMAFEDFGRADLNLTADVVAAASSARWRATVGGDWHVASFLMGKLLDTPRDRFLDDLYTTGIAIATTAYELPQSRSPVHLTIDKLVASAVQMVRGCERPIPGRLWRSTIPANCDTAIRQARHAKLIDDDLVEVCLQARRTSQSLLPVLLPHWLGAVRDSGDDRSIVTWGVPPQTNIEGLPSWAFDGYTRAGRIALWELYRRNSQVRAIPPPELPGPAKIDCLQALLFEVEGALATEFLSHPLAENLRQRSWGCWSHLPVAALHDAGLIMQAAIPELNALRQEVWASSTGSPGALT